MMDTALSRLYELIMTNGLPVTVVFCISARLLSELVSVQSLFPCVYPI